MGNNSENSKLVSWIANCLRNFARYKATHTLRYAHIATSYLQSIKTALFAFGLLFWTTFSVQAEPLTIITSTLPAATEDQLYSIELLATASNGGAVSWRVKSGDTLPEWLSLGTDYEVSTFAGEAYSSGNSDGTGMNANFYYPNGIAADSSGNLYVADTENHTIRKITSAGLVTTFAGTAGVSGIADGVGSNVRFYVPLGLAVDASDNVYVADYFNHVIRKITPSGEVTTVAGLAGESGSADGQSEARFHFPVDITVSVEGNLYVTDAGNHTVRKISSEGTVSTLAGLAGSYGSVDAIGSEARFDVPLGITIDSENNLYVVDSFSHVIRKVTQLGEVTTIAGSAYSSEVADGTGSDARFYAPWGITMHPTGDLYVASRYAGVVRKVTTAGKVTTVAGAAWENENRDGIGGDARFDSPYGIAAGKNGVIYVSDTDSHVIRKINNNFLKGIPSQEYVGTSSEFCLEALDSDQNAAEQCFTITVSELNDAPQLQGAARDKIVLDNVATALDLSAYSLSDEEGDLITLTLTVDRGNLASIDGDGIVDSITVAGSDSASITLQGTAADLNREFKSQVQRSPTQPDVALQTLL